MDKRIYLIWISRMNGIGINKLNILLEKYHNLENIWNLKKEDLEKLKGIGQKTAEIILDKKYRENLDKYLELKV